MEQLLPKIIEGGIGIFCIGILSYLLWTIFRSMNENIKEQMKDNKEQTVKFDDTTREFINVVKEQNIKIDSKLDNISNKIDNIKKTQD